MIETPRLVVRPWREADRAPYHALCRDPEVMRFLGPLQSRAENDAAIDRMIAETSAECDWDTMGKWHRVRFRMMRIQREWAGCETDQVDSQRLSATG